MSDFTMPSLGADMEEGKLVQWLVKPGDTVRKGDIVAVVETHKGAIDVEIFEDATVLELCASEGETIEVGGLLARLQGPGQPPPPPLKRDVAPSLQPASREAAIATGLPITRSGRTKASPAARQLAAQYGIELDQLEGTGVGGSISYADVELARASPSGSRVKAARTRHDDFGPKDMRSAIAKAMARSKREIPHYYLSNTVDMSPSLQWLASYNEERPPAERMLAAALLLKATAVALHKVPQLNGFWKDDDFSPGAGVHICWAISLRGGGLVSPAIHDVDTLALPTLMEKLRDIVARARTGGLRSSELMDGTVTVTSLGERGADGVTGVIYPPQVAIVGFGRIRERPWVVDGQVMPRSLVDVSLAADHRASDGHAGGLFLSTLEQCLQEPEAL